MPRAWTSLMTLVCQPYRRGCWGTNLYGSVSGTTLTCVVNLNGTGPPLGKVNSAKNAVHPLAGRSTLATYTPPPWSLSGLSCHTGPSVSIRKSRALGFVACQSFTPEGASFATTRIDPSFCRVQLNLGNGRLVMIAS